MHWQFSPTYPLGWLAGCLVVIMFLDCIQGLHPRIASKDCIQGGFLNQTKEETDESLTVYVCVHSGDCAE